MKNKNIVPRNKFFDIFIPYESRQRAEALLGYS
jgi:hypothetical protein